MLPFAISARKQILFLLLTGFLFIPTIEAAEYFSGRVWYDLNKNGIEDAGEPGVSGARAKVGNTTTVTTDANGNWTSPDLRSGSSYTVTFSNIPAGYVFSPQNQGSDDTKDSDPNPVTGVTANYTAVRNSTIYNIDAGIYLPVPEMDIQGNSSSILDGDTSPSINDHTYFGSTDIVSGSVAHTFTIENTGDGTLELDGSPVVSLSGAHPEDFSVTSQPSITSLSPLGGTTTFIITFDPVSASTHSATVSISNNDSDEDPYNFDIQGTGTSVPEIDVRGNNISIPDGDTSPSSGDNTIFGDADIYGGAHTHVYTINNSGSGDLSLTGVPIVSIGGINAGDFSVSQQPVSSTVAAQGGSQSFQITFDPTTTGLRQATVTILSTDGDESPYTFAIQGTGTINPEIDIKGNNITIADNDITPATSDSTNFGSLLVGGTTRVVTYRIYNTGPATLNLTGSWPLVDISGPHAGDFSVYSAPASSIAPGGSTSFKIAFDPVTAGTRSATLTIANNDLSEDSYSFAIQGTGTYATAPLSEIDIQVSLVSIPNGTSAPSFGSVAVNGGSFSQTFNIKNTGTEDLIVTAYPLASISGANASDFAITQQPSSPIAPGASSPFVIAFSPSAGGTRSAYVTIENNDADESPYTITLQGTGLTSPEIQVRGNNIEIVSGDASPSMTDSTYFGNVTASLGNRYVTYRIYNLGSTTLTLNGVTPVVITGAAQSEFAVTSQPATTIATGSSSPFVVKFDPSQVGLRNAAISITSDDADEGTYLFAIQGNGTGPGSALACVPNFFHVFGDNGTITYMDATTNPYSYTTIVEAGYSINGVGYNLEDGLLYGFEQDTDIPGDSIVQVDGRGIITVLSGVTVPFLSWRADFNDSGDMYFWNEAGNQVGIFDASTGEITTQNAGGPDWLPIDMAYLDADGCFYGIQTTTLYKYDPEFNVVSTSPISGRLADEYATGTNSEYYGACWSANDGYLYSANSQSGRMYKVNVEGESIYVGQAEANLNKSDGASCPLADAPLPSTGSIGDKVWIDADADGIQDATEVGLPGVTVSLYFSDDNFIASTVTDQNGSYAFQNLAPSDYYLRFSAPPAGFALTLQDQGSNNLLDSDADQTTGKTEDFHVDVGLIDAGLDAGYTATGMGNYVWNDLDHDGVQDANEVGVPGVTVQRLLASDNSVQATTTTDAYGAYKFTSVTPGSYKMKISNLPGGFIITAQNAGGNDLTDSDVSTSTGISGSYTLVSGQFNATVDAGIYQQTSPEINLKGNNVTIVDGDTLPALADSTDFGSKPVVSGAMLHTFTIQNLTGANLTLNGNPVVAISGPHAADFVVTTQPASTSIAAGGSTTFKITFNPSGLGLRSAVVSISNNDSNENPYDFSIQGTGLAPEIQLKGNNINIVTGDITPQTADGTSFGSADIVSGLINKTFKIFNLGNSALSLTGASPYVTFSGTHAAEFTVIANPATSIAAGDSTFFTLQFNPAGVGVRTATVSIANTDGDENPFTFSIQGTGTAIPEMEIQAGTEFITDGDITPSTADLTDFGSRDIFSESATHTFTIRNTGSGDLLLTGVPIVQISGTNAGDFILSVQPASSTVIPSGTVTFQVTFDPTTTGVRKATINIANNDADENPYDFAIQGLGTSTLDQEIEVLGAGLVISTGDVTPRTQDNTDMGTATISGVPVTRTFVIRNIGYAVLNLTGPPPYVSLTGTHAAEFTITGSPANTVGIDSATTSFVISFTPAGLGTRQATVNIQNNDADESPYTFSIRGDGVYNPNSQSEINVQGNMISIADEDVTPASNDGTDFGSVEVVGGTASQEFVIHNLGVDDLVLGSTPPVSISGTNASDFTVITQPPALVSPSSSVAMTITFNPSATGVRSASIVIGNSDPNENPYNFSIQGLGTTTPQISVSGNGLTIVKGDMTAGTDDSTYFGSVDLSLGLAYKTYTIHNTGSSALSLTGTTPVTTGGSSDFSISTQPSLSISSGGSSSFVVVFNPAMVGQRNAIISIASNDPDDSPYSFAVQGDCDGPGDPISCVPNFYQIYGSSGTIAYLDASTTPYTYTTLATAGYRINGVGYNPEDGLLYGFENSWGISGSNMIRIDANGGITVLSSVSIPFISNVADFDDTGDFYFYSSNQTTLAILDVSAGTYVTTTPSGGAFLPEDMSFIESTGNFYGVYQTTLYSYNPNNNTVSTAPITGKLTDDYNASTNGTDFGAAWTAFDGYLYTANNTSGRMYKINVGTQESIFVGESPSASDNDGASCPSASAPLPTTGTIGNYVWLDNDGDGIQDGSESGMAGVQVSLYDGDDTFLGSVTTGSDGLYAFVNLSPSQYYLSFTNAPTGFSPSPQNQGANDELDSDIDPSTNKTPVFTVDIGSVDNTWDAGFKATGVGDFVWLDSNEDGLQTTGEVGVPGITVTLKLDPSGTTVASTVTNASGYYAFTGLSPATSYKLYFSGLPAGYAFSAQNQGSNDNIDSDVNTSTGQSAAFTLSNGVFNSSIDAGVFQQSEPEINVRGNNLSISDGDNTPSTSDHTDFGSISAMVDSVIYNFYVLNMSGTDLTLNGSPKVSISGTNAAEFVVKTQPAETIVAGDSSVFSIRFIPAAEGLRSATVNIANTDANENPYNFSIRGFGLASEIQISGNGLIIADGDTSASTADFTDFGSQDISTGSQAQIFTILNTGNANLVLTEPSPHVVITGDHAADFSITTPPISPIASNNTTSFTVTFDPTAEGLRKAVVSLANNDLDENPYTFTIQGVGSATPEIEVKYSGETIGDGDATPSTLEGTDFGSKDILTETQVNTFTILNAGSGALALTGTPMVLLGGTHAGDFLVSEQPASNSVSPDGGTVTFDVTFNPTSVGLRSATISIASSDADENPFNFSIQGTGIASADIDVLGNGLSIASGDMVPGLLDSTVFDSTIVDSAFSITYTLVNSGSAILNLTGGSPYVTLSGDHASDFSVTSIPTATVAAGGGETSFTITFTPSAEGFRDAIVSIASDDVDENPYSFAIKGFGLPTPQPELALTETVDLAVAAPGDTLTYTVIYSNVGVGLATNVVVDEVIPDNVTYLTNSAAGEGMIIVFSHDNGNNFDASQTAPVTHIRYRRSTALLPGANGTVTFRVIVD